MDDRSCEKVLIVEACQASWLIYLTATLGGSFPVMVKMAPPWYRTALQSFDEKQRSPFDLYPDGHPMDTKVIVNGLETRVYGLDDVRKSNAQYLGWRMTGKGLRQLQISLVCKYESKTFELLS